MQEIINGINNKDKEIFEISKHLTDYLIEKKQTAKNGEYVGKVDRFERLQESRKIAEFIKEKEENKETIIEKLKKDLNEIEPVKENAYYYCKVLNLIIEFNELIPIKEAIFEVSDRNKDEYKVEVAYILGQKDLIATMDINEFNNVIEEIVDDFLNNTEKPYISEFLEDFLDKHYIPKNNEIIYKILDLDGDNEISEFVKVINRDKDTVVVKSIIDGEIFDYDKEFFDKNKKIATKEELSVFKDEEIEDEEI